MNSLDLTISKMNCKHDFAIYGKQSHTDITIHINSLHPYQPKYAAYHSMIPGLISIEQTSQNFDKELRIITQIAYDNAFEADLIDNILAIHGERKAISEIYLHVPNDKEKNYKSVSYFGKPSGNIATFLRTQEVNFSVRTTNPLGSLIKNNKKENGPKAKIGSVQVVLRLLLYGVSWSRWAISDKISRASYIIYQSKLNSNYVVPLNTKHHLFIENLDISQIQK